MLVYLVQGSSNEVRNVQLKHLELHAFHFCKLEISFIGYM